MKWKDIVIYLLIYLLIYLFIHSLFVSYQTLVEDEDDEELDE